MGAEGRLSPRKLRRVEGIVGRPLAFAIATHSPWVDAVTPGPRHEHVIVNLRTGESLLREDPVHWHVLCSKAEADSAG